MDSRTSAVDVAETVFEIAVANERGQIVQQNRLGRSQFMRVLTTQPPSKVVMEAWETARHWGASARQHGHQVTLLPPVYVRSFVRRNKDRSGRDGGAGRRRAR